MLLLMYPHTISEGITVKLRLNCSHFHPAHFCPLFYFSDFTVSFSSFRIPKDYFVLHILDPSTHLEVYFENSKSCTDKDDPPVKDGHRVTYREQKQKQCWPDGITKEFIPLSGWGISPFSD